MKPSVLIYGEATQVAALTVQLERGRQFVTVGFSRVDMALQEIRAELPDVVVCDLDVPDVGGFEFMRRVRAVAPALPVIIKAPGAAGDVADQAFAAGATDFVTQPMEFLEARIRHALDRAPAQELATSVAAAKFDRHGIVGHHPLVAEVRRFVDCVAGAGQVTALLLGESGTGKNLVARAIHGASGQASRRFVEINCAALPETMLEAELFGYGRGAFTDARESKRGLVEVADGGTLMLDEIGSMPLDLQAKLLSFLESRSFRRLGSTTDQSVSIRVIAATNADLEVEARAGRFREDLFYRLNVASHVLPPLRAIPSDIPEMARHFVKRAAEYFGKPVPEIDAEGIQRLQAYSWPGNARELRNIIERSMIFSRGLVIGIEELAGAVAVPVPAANGIVVVPGLTLAEVERIYIEATLQALDGNVAAAAAAEQLGITRKVLWLRRKVHGLLDEAS